MKKTLTIFLIIIATLVIIFTGIRYLLTGRIIPSLSCGSDFNAQFSRAVSNDNFDFCSSFQGRVRYSKDPIYGRYYCRTQKVGEMREGFSIRKDDFRDSCLETMSAASNNIKACELISGSSAKISCILGIRHSTGDKSYCDLISDDDLIRGKCLQ